MQKIRSVSLVISVCLAFGLAMSACQPQDQPEQPAPTATTTNPVQTAGAVDDSSPTGDADTNAETADQDNEQDEQPDKEKDSQDADEDQTQAREVSLRTTFTQLLEWGLSEEEIESVLDGELPADLDMRLKNYCKTAGIDGDSVVAALQQKVDELD